MRVGDIMTPDVRTVAPADSFADTAKVLAEHRISSVVVKDGDAVVGIVTERDIVHAVADGVDPKATSVGERMTKDLATVERKTDVADAARLMGERRIRHLPVLDKGSLAGFLLILSEVVTLSAFRPWEEWVNIALGAWLIVSPFILKAAALTPKADFVLVGLAVVALAFYELWEVGRNSAQK